MASKYSAEKKPWLEARGFEEASFEDWLNERAEFLQNTPDYLLIKDNITNKDILGQIKSILGGFPGIYHALNFVQEQEKWYEWDDSVDSASEAAERTVCILNHFANGKKGTYVPNKEFETTLASLFIACVGAKAGVSPVELCEQIHDAWCCTNAYTESLEKLKTREAQYKPFHELTMKEQKKDLVWIRGVLHATMMNELTHI